MKFLVDANLPSRLALKLRSLGFDTLHTDDLPNKERTTDKEIRKTSVEENRILITKDSDFFDSHLILGVPGKLLFITTGNIVNSDLLELLEKNFATIARLFEIYDLIEVNRREIIGHEK
jgi:predicted nuclease of predicted toxin-antitoxin system